MDYETKVNKYNRFHTTNKKDQDEYLKQKEILFIKNDLKAVNTNTKKYDKISKFYKEKLVEMGAMRKLKDSCNTWKQKGIKKKIIVA